MRQRQRSAHFTAELITVPERTCDSVRGRGRNGPIIEKVISAESRITIVGKKRPVDIFGAAWSHQSDLGSAIPLVSFLVPGRNGEFTRIVNRWSPRSKISCIRSNKGILNINSVTGN